jgi:hypothetical protein
LNKRAAKTLTHSNARDASERRPEANARDKHTKYEYSLGLLEFFMHGGGWLLRAPFLTSLAGGRWRLHGNSQQLILFEYLLLDTVEELAGKGTRVFAAWMILHCDVN